MRKQPIIILESSRAGTRLLFSMLIAALLLFLVYAAISAGMPTTENTSSTSNAKPGLNSMTLMLTLPSKELACSSPPTTACVSISQGCEKIIPPSQAIGSVVTFTHLVTNCSDDADAVTVTVNSTTPAWLKPVLSSFITSITACSSKPIIVSANISDVPEEGELPGYLWVTATSWADTSVTAVAQDKVDVRWHYVFLPIVLKNYALFCNGSFETGDLTCWTRFEDPTSFPVHVVTPSIDSDYNHFGTNAVRIGRSGWVRGGGIPQGCFGIAQAAVVTDILSPTLRFEYSLYSYDVMTGAEQNNIYDSLDVTINDSGACPRYTHDPVPDTCLWRAGNPTPDPPGKEGPPWASDPQTFTQMSVSLSKYSGELVTVYFLVCNRRDDTRNTWAYIDNIDGDFQFKR